MKLPFIQPCVFMSGLVGLSSYSNMSLYDISKYRLINKDFNKEFIYNKYDIVNNRLTTQYPELLIFASANNIDIVSYLIDSDFNIVEFDRICTNMCLMKTRNYRVKYGYLFKHHFFDRYTPHHNLDTINKNIKIFRLLYDYAGFLMKKQQRAPTDIQKYPCLWLSDYMQNFMTNKLERDISSYPIIDIIGIDYFKDILSTCMYDFNILNLYEILLQSCLKDFKQNLVLSLSSSTFKEFTLILNVFISVYDRYKTTNDKDIIDYIFYHILGYLRNSLLSIGKNNFADIFLASVVDKINETLGIIEFHKQNNTVTQMQLDMEILCRELLQILYL